MIMTETVTFRPITPEDKAFLYNLYASTRETELSVTGWDEAQKTAFLRMQFDAQHRHYQEHYTETRFDVIVLNGEAVGRLYLACWPEELRIVDIALLPAWRNKGIGSGIIKDILHEAGERGLPVRIHVERFNPALHLYYRLGFQKISDKGIYYLLEWSS